MTFGLSSNNPLATAALKDCSFTLYGGEGEQSMTTEYRLLGTIASGSPATAKVVRSLTKLPASSPAKKGRKARKIFLMANASCPAKNVSVWSAPLQVKASKKRGSLKAKSWMGKLSKGLQSP